MDSLRCFTLFLETLYSSINEILQKPRTENDTVAIFDYTLTDRDLTYAKRWSISFNTTMSQETVIHFKDASQCDGFYDIFLERLRKFFLTRDYACKYNMCIVDDTCCSMFVTFTNLSKNRNDVAGGLISIDDETKLIKPDGNQQITVKTTEIDINQTSFDFLWKPLCEAELVLLWGSVRFYARIITKPNTFLTPYTIHGTELEQLERFVKFRKFVNSTTSHRDFLTKFDSLTEHEQNDFYYGIATRYVEYEVKTV